MKSIDEAGIKLCKYQAQLFEMSHDLAGCSSAVFIRRFMNSNAAKRIDNSSLLFEAISINELFDEINSQYGESSYGKIKYSKEELYWIGYIYRYWCYTHNQSSKYVYGIISAYELKKLYFPYHSLDPKMAIERICEAKNISNEISIEKGVEILRKKLNKNTK